MIVKNSQTLPLSVLAKMRIAGTIIQVFTRTFRPGVCTEGAALQVHFDNKLCCEM